MSDGFFDDVANTESVLLGDLKTMVARHADSHPRSQQTTLGPSQIGHPCLRHLAQAMYDQTKPEQPINPPGDPLPSYIGVAGHAKLEDAVALDNSRLEALGQPRRWLSETKVEVRPGLSGTCDLYDIATGTVIDFKFPGTTAATKYRKSGPSPEYRVQAHAYARGYTRLGFDVKHVGIYFLPRAGQLRTSWLWTEPFNPLIVDEALARIDLALMFIDDLDVDHHPERFAIIPTTPHNCGFCAYFSPVDNHPNPLACKGWDA